MDKDECTNGEHNCHINGVCTNSVGSFSCHCDNGYEGDGVKCVNTNECLPYNTNNCNTAVSECNDTIGSYTCPCKTGFKSKTPGAEVTSELVCINVDECNDLTDSCNRTVSYCVDNFGSFDCPCRDGFEMTPYGFCDNINECQRRNECPLMAVCVDGFGYYECRCPEGYDSVKADNSNIVGTKCKDIDECADRNKFCHSSAPYCSNSDGSFECQCDAGYEYDGECHDINECEVGSATCDHNCDNKQPHEKPLDVPKDVAWFYECSCEIGFKCMTDNESNSTCNGTCVEVVIPQAASFPGLQVLANGKMAEPPAADLLNAFSKDAIERKKAQTGSALDSIAQMIEDEIQLKQKANLTLNNLQNALRAAILKDMSTPEFDDEYLTNAFDVDNKETIAAFTNNRVQITAKFNQMLKLIENTMENFPNDDIATLPNVSMVRSQTFEKPFDFTNQELIVRFDEKSSHRRSGPNSNHAVISVLKQNPYKNEETTTMDNPVINFKAELEIESISSETSSIRQN